MKCFYHENRDAVAQCTHCGKALCKECASRYIPCTCEDCYNFLAQQHMEDERRQAELERQEYEDTRLARRKSFLKSCVIGIIVAYAIVPFYWKLGLSECLPFAIVSSVLLFSAPFAWKTISNLQSQGRWIIFASIDFWLFVIWMKAMISFVIGIPCLAYQIYKTFFAPLRYN